MLSILVGMVNLLSDSCFCISSYVHQQLHSLDCQHFVHDISLVLFTSLSTSWVQGFIFEEDLQFSKLFKMTICKGMCTLKCTEKRVILFTPSILLHKFFPHTEFKGSPDMSTGMYCNTHLLEIMRRSAFKSPLSYPSS